MSPSSVSDFSSPGHQAAEIFIQKTLKMNDAIKRFSKQAHAGDWSMMPLTVEGSFQFSKKNSRSSSPGSLATPQWLVPWYQV